MRFNFYFFLWLTPHAGKPSVSEPLKIEMAGITKKARQLRNNARKARAAKRAQALQSTNAIDPSLAVPQHLIERVGDDSEEGSWFPGQQPAPAAVHWDECWDSESEESEEECEFTDGEENDSEELEFDENAFQKLLAEAKNIGASEGPNLCYQRGQHASVRAQFRAQKRAHELQLAAMDSRPLDAGWLQKAPTSQAPSPVKQKLAPNEEVLQDLDKKLRSKKTKLTGHNLTRHSRN